MLGMRRLAADIVWIQALQYYGANSHAGHEGPHGKEEDHNHEHESYNNDSSDLYPLLKGYWQQVIRLDPFFVSAYLTGPISLGWNLKRTNEAMALLDEGIKGLMELSEKFGENNINYTELKHPMLTQKVSNITDIKNKLLIIKSTIIYFDQEKYSEAAKALAVIAFDEETPEDVRVILAQIYEKQRDYNNAIKLWQIIYNTSRKPDRIESALKHINELKNITASN